jgi:RNA polymerase sigma factor for flagellar operon FliA
VVLRPELEKLVADLMPDARQAARRVFHAAPYALDLDELTSLAYIGLVTAANQWDDYCARHQFDNSGAGLQYFRAYCLRRIRGSMLDAMRSADWMTRSARTRAKALREAGQDLGKSEEELARATGMSVRQVRETMTAALRKPVYMDDSEADPPDSDDVESSAVVGSVLSAMVSAMRGLALQHQAVLALRYHQGWEFAQIAEELEESPERVQRIHDQAISVCTTAMLRSVE